MTVPAAAAARSGAASQANSAEATRPRAQQRERRAAIAQRLVDLAPAAVDAIDWDALDHAPDWLALPDAAFLILQARLGALLHLPAMRLWIDGPRLAATRVLLGEAVLDDLLSHPESAMPDAGPRPRLGPAAAAGGAPLSSERPGDGCFGLTPCVPIESAAQVGPSLRAAGVSVLLAALLPGAVREALCRGLAPVQPARMARELAETLIVRARMLGAR